MGNKHAADISEACPQTSADNSVIVSAEKVRGSFRTMYEKGECDLIRFGMSEVVGEVYRTTRETFSGHFLHRPSSPDDRHVRI